MTIYYAVSPNRSPDKIFKTLCGDKQPQSYDLHAAGVEIRFKSDGSVERKGFRLRYQSLGNYHSTTNNRPDSRSSPKLRFIQRDLSISLGGGPEHLGKQLLTQYTESPLIQGSK